MDAVIFDIDGTLANVEHRRDKLPDWDAFFSGMVNDTAVDDIVWLYNSLKTGVKSNVFFCTGRPEKYRGETTQWLVENVEYKMANRTLLMRADGDFRSDVIVKREMLAEIQADGYNVRLVIDDRKSVVDMWRAEGITCLQCAPGFDETPVVIETNEGPPDLVIMVGPSGAGKDEVIARSFGRFAPSQIISSDAIRENLCGDFQDQSRNADVFAVFHRLIRTNLECGVSTVANATNIRNKDRRAVVELAPPGTRIMYLVVDRTLERKIATGGWRNGVIMDHKRGTTLIEKHHATMQSNLKAILAGDGDSNVEIKDLRGEEMEALDGIVALKGSAIHTTYDTKEEVFEEYVFEEEEAVH